MRTSALHVLCMGVERVMLCYGRLADADQSPDMEWALWD